MATCTSVQDIYKKKVRFDDQSEEENQMKRSSKRKPFGDIIGGSLKNGVLVFIISFLAIFFKDKYANYFKGFLEEAMSPEGTSSGRITTKGIIIMAIIIGVIYFVISSFLEIKDVLSE